MTDEPSLVFLVERNEFKDAVSYLFSCRTRNRKPGAEYFDVDSGNTQIEMEVTGASSSCSAVVEKAGYARAPLIALEWCCKALRSIKDDRLRIHFSAGQLKMGSLIFKHEGISLRHRGGRLIDLPVDAPLPDVLALLTLFTAEEIEESGMLARVRKADRYASRLIDRAAKTLAPLGTTRNALDEFIKEQLNLRIQQSN